MREKLYRVYMSDLLKGIATQMGLQVEQRYRDLAYPAPVVEETRTPDEIISNIRAKLKKLGEGE